MYIFDIKYGSSVKYISIYLVGQDWRCPKRLLLLNHHALAVRLSRCEIPKSPTWDVIVSTNQTLAGFRLEWTMEKEKLWWRYVIPWSTSLRMINHLFIPNLQLFSLQCKWLSRLPYDMNSIILACKLEHTPTILTRFWCQNLPNVFHSFIILLYAPFNVVEFNTPLYIDPLSWAHWLVTSSLGNPNL